MWVLMGGRRECVQAVPARKDAIAFPHPPICPAGACPPNHAEGGEEGCGIDPDGVDGKTGGGVSWNWRIKLEAHAPTVTIPAGKLHPSALAIGTWMRFHVGG